MPTSSTKLGRPEMKREENYWWSRRSLRLRPVGKGDADSAAKLFMTEHLHLDSSFMDALGPIVTQRVPSGPAAKFKDEVIVTYHSTEVRDAVKSAARNLAGKGPDYGVRLEVPNHLKTNLNALQAASYQIKTKHPNARRNVLFEGDSMDLVLDFRLDEGRPWNRMSSSQAKLRKKKRASSRDRLTLNDSDLDRILDAEPEGSASE